MKNIWEQFCQEVAGNLDEGHYNVWIAALKGVLKDNTLNIYAKNEFVSKFLQIKYKPLFESSLDKVLGVKSRVVFSSSTPPSEAMDSYPFSKLSRPNAKVEEVIESDKISLLPHLGESQPVSDDYRQSVIGLSDINTPEVNPMPLYASTATVLPAGQSCTMPNPIVYTAKNDSCFSNVAPQYALPLNWSESNKTRNWRFNFNDFVVGPSNELAHAAAKNICGVNPSQRCLTDMLFLCSSPGLGKTHLLQSVGSTLFHKSNYAMPRIEYVTAEEFATQMRMALREGEIERFKARFRQADVLLLEDVHFLQDKEKTQQELLSTISTLLDRGSKVVLSSSFAPRDLRKMDDQLVSRFSTGLIAGIERPDREMRKRIISTKAFANQVSISDDVADYIAENIDSDVRQIESCLKTLALKAQILNGFISLDMAIETLSKCTLPSSRLTIAAIARMVCEGFGISSDELASKSRKQQYVLARNAVFYLARKHTELSLQQIGKHFNRTHSTVIKGITTLEREITKNSSSGRQIANAIQMIEKRSQLPVASL